MSARALQCHRGDGTTTRQMQQTPKGGFYIWCNSSLVYPKALARHLGREDLQIVSPHWLTERQFSGLKLSGLTVDHALQLSREQYDSYLLAKAYVGRAE